MKFFRKLLMAKKMNKVWMAHWKDWSHVYFVEKMGLKKAVDYSRQFKEVESERGESHYDFLKRRIKRGVKIIESTPIDSEWISTLWGIAKDVKKDLRDLKRLESEYIFAAGHSRMLNTHLFGYYRHPNFNWGILGGKKKDIFLAGARNLDKVYNSEWSKTFSNFESYAKDVIETFANFRDNDAGIEKIWFKNNKIFVKAKNLGMVIGRNGSRIKAMEKLTGRKVVAIQA